MTEDEARAWVAATYPRATGKLERLAALVTAENTRQNLVASSTTALLWSRHIADSVQLAGLAEGIAGRWVDVGTGGGFPGLAVAVVRDEPVTLVEPRRRRAEFLISAAAELGLSHVAVRHEKVERTEGTAAIISARAVASVEHLLRAAGHLADAKTVWLLPRGQRTERDETYLQQQRTMFHVKQSLTADARILVIGQSAS